MRVDVAFDTSSLAADVKRFPSGNEFVDLGNFVNTFEDVGSNAEAAFDDILGEQIKPGVGMTLGIVTRSIEGLANAEAVLGFEAVPSGVLFAGAIIVTGAIIVVGATPGTERTPSAEERLGVTWSGGA